MAFVTLNISSSRTFWHSCTIWTHGLFRFVGIHSQLERGSQVHRGHAKI